MWDKIVRAIKNLGNGTQKAGDCGLLQVLCSYPSPPDSDALEEAAKRGHPLAIVPIHLLNPEVPELAQAIAALTHRAKEDLMKRGRAKRIEEEPNELRKSDPRKQGNQ